MTISAFQHIPSSISTSPNQPPKILSLIKNLIHSHIQNLLVSKNSSLEYLKFLENYRESPFYLIRDHLETQWEDRIRRFEKLILEHESICFLTYKSASLAVQLPLQDSFRKFIQNTSRNNELHKYLLDAFRAFRRVYSYVQIVVQRTGMASQRYSEWFPKSWESLLRDDRDVVSTLAQRSSLKSGVKDTVDSMLTRLTRHIEDRSREIAESIKERESRKDREEESLVNRRYRVTPRVTRHSDVKQTSEEMQGNDSYHSGFDSSKGRAGETTSEVLRNSESMNASHPGDSTHHSATDTTHSSLERSHLPDQSIRFQPEPPQHEFDNMPTSYYFIHDRYNADRINAFDIARHEDLAVHKTPYIGWSAPDRNLTGSEYRYHSHEKHAFSRPHKENHRARPHHPSEEEHIRAYFQMKEEDEDHRDSRKGTKRRVAIWQHHHRPREEKFGIPRREQPKWA